MYVIINQRDERNALSFPFRAVPLFPLTVLPRQTKEGEGDGGFSRERGTTS
jgi:hypothetical protein